jgi:hypothetical protein
MKRIILLIFSMFAVLLILSYSSLPDNDSGNIKYYILLSVVFILSGILNTFSFVVWKKGTLKVRFQKSLLSGFLLITVSFILGYGFILFQSFIKQ